MIKTLPRFGLLEYSLVLLVALAGTTQLTAAQGAQIALPANASVKTFGNGWECDTGYRKQVDACVSVTLPENAYQTDSS